MRAVDVDHVKRNRDAGDPARFGDELVGDQVWRNLVQDPGYLERQRRFAPELSGGPEWHRGDAAAHRRGDILVLVLELGQRPFQGATRREVAIESRAADVRGSRQL